MNRQSQLESEFGIHGIPKTGELVSSHDTYTKHIVHDTEVYSLKINAKEGDYVHGSKSTQLVYVFERCAYLVTFDPG